MHFKGGFDSTATSDIYGQFDVLVVPSLWLENSPLVIHEAFQAGVPVVGSRMGGTRDLVRDGRMGSALRCGLAGRAGGASCVRSWRIGACWTMWCGAPAPVKSIDEDAREWEATYQQLVCRGRTGVSEPLVSIVLLTRNGGSDLRELVGAIARQRADFAFEIVAVDSGSTDGTADWLEQSPSVARVVRIAPDSSTTAPRATWASSRRTASWSC